jgi:protein KRI1
VKPESYGLSDEQILFGDDKELNKYVSVKKLAPYREEAMKLRNSIFKQRIKGIKRSVKQNQNMLTKAPAKIEKMRYMNKRKIRVESVRKRLEKRLRIVNISSK